MSYLLLPEDERELVTYLCDDLGWGLITGAIERGTPIAFAAPSVALSGDLPVAGDHATGPLWVLLFWSPEWGRAIAIGDAPEPTDLVRRVLRSRRGGDTGALDNVIDVHIARLRRKVDVEQALKLIHTVRGVGFMLREGEP